MSDKIDITEESLSKIRAAVEKATEGPWVVFQDSLNSVALQSKIGLYVAEMVWDNPDDTMPTDWQANADFIALTDPTTILAMCDRIEELEKENEYYETRSVPAGTPPIVCLCGSTRFMDAFFEAGWQFTLQGEIVLSVGVCKHAEDHGGEALGQDVADKLDELHFRKIDLADRVFVLNVDGYIGDSTRKEIEYAASKDKPIQYLEALKPKGNSNGK